MISDYELDSIKTNREYKANADALLIDVNGDTLYEGALKHIKTRGNSTFKRPKKPYAIKFFQKQSFLGLYRSKTFILLANYMDESYIRNAIAFDIAHMLDVPAPQYAYVSLYINGDYQGLYQMTNKVDFSRQWLDIQDLEEENELVNPRKLNRYEPFIGEEKDGIVQQKGVLIENYPEDITGGYLLDNSALNWIYSNSKSGFVSNAGDEIRIKNPEHASREEVEYITDIYNRMETAVLAADGIHPITGVHYSEYLNIESFARYYLINELLMNEDGGCVSFMTYKNSDTIDSLFYAGPIWDFDCSLNYPKRQVYFCEPNEIYVGAKVGRFDEPHSGGLLYHLLRHEDFRDAVRTIWVNEMSAKCHEYIEDNRIGQLEQVLSYEAKLDNQLYHTLQSTNYHNAVTNAKDFLEQRIAFFDWYWTTTANNMVDVVCAIVDGKPHQRHVHFYYRLGEPIKTPKLLKEIKYNNDSLLTIRKNRDGTLVLDWRKPNQVEVLWRRLCKKAKKLTKLLSS